MTYYLQAIPLLLATMAAAGTARAEPFRYVDREGHVHVLAVDRAVAPIDDARQSPNAPADEEFPYASFVREAAALYAVEPELIRAVMRAESALDPHAVSPAGAQGLMQLMPATAAELGVLDPFDPRENILGGARQLRAMLNAFNGDTRLALAAYHAGAASVRRSGGIPASVVTRRYVTTVLAILRKLEAEARARGTG